MHLFIHDLIPIDYPEFVTPHSRARHEGRLRTVSELASGILVNSDYTRHSVETYLNAKQLPLPPIKVVPLGVSDWFYKTQELDPPRPAVPYFVAVSTIEPRKNFLFLFSVWRRLIELLGNNAPRLVIVGHRGWENENVIDILERSRSLGPFLVEATDITDGGLASLLSGAQALIAPSTVEGFGLPVAEALALGVPVIASDIAAHREVAAMRSLHRRHRRNKLVDYPTAIPHPRLTGRPYVEDQGTLQAHQPSRACRRGSLLHKFALIHPARPHLQAALHVR